MKLLNQFIVDGMKKINRNSINLDLDWLTKLKIKDSTDVNKIYDTDIFIDSSDVKQYIFTDENGSLNWQKNYN